MPSDLSLRCRCGHVRGAIRDASSIAGLRFTCYCRDCRAFARFLERADVLDGAGGSDLYQLAPTHLRLTGTDAMRCLRLSAAVLRWYAECCRTPIANTAVGSRFPIIGLNLSMIDREVDGCDANEILGPSRFRLHAASALAPLPPNSPGGLSAGIVLRRSWMILVGRLRRLDRPNPFFDGATTAPVAAPRVLTPNESAVVYDDG